MDGLFKVLLQMCSLTFLVMNPTGLTLTEGKKSQTGFLGDKKYPDERRSVKKSGSVQRATQDLEIFVRKKSRDLAAQMDS